MDRAANTFGSCDARIKCSAVAVDDASTALGINFSAVDAVADEIWAEGDREHA